MRSLQKRVVWKERVKKSPQLSNEKWLIIDVAAVVTARHSLCLPLLLLVSLSSLHSFQIYFNREFLTKWKVLRETDYRFEGRQRTQKESENEGKEIEQRTDSRKDFFRFLKNTTSGFNQRTWMLFNLSDSPSGSSTSSLFPPPCFWKKVAVEKKRRGRSKYSKDWQKNTYDVKDTFFLNDSW